ncbi:MAG: hypothetical protein JWM43_202 [Acidobacteriaceae bacterium]|nr:hypothetical protein [Acidobacteriaceae bacterium]
MTRLIVRRGLLLLVAVWMVGAASVWGQNAVVVAKPLAYGVVSIKPNKSGSSMMRMQMMPDRYLATGVPLKQLLLFAYDLKLEDQIAGLSGAVADGRFDIEAKIDEETVAALKKLSQDEVIAQRRVMLQAVLAERFRLKLHQEKRELPVYALAIAKGGPRLKEADPNNTYPNGIKGPDGVSHPGMVMMRRDGLTAQAVPMSDLARVLGNQVHRLVVDKTGLTGKYDIALQWTSDENRGAGMEDAGTAANSDPSIFTALQEELGLKLDSSKGMVDMVVVDSVSVPSEN